MYRQDVFQRALATIALSDFGRWVSCHCVYRVGFASSAPLHPPPAPTRKHTHKCMPRFCLHSTFCMCAETCSVGRLMVIVPPATLRLVFGFVGATLSASETPLPGGRAKVHAAFLNALSDAVLTPEDSHALVTAALAVANRVASHACATTPSGDLVSVALKVVKFLKKLRCVLVLLPQPQPQPLPSTLHTHGPSWVVVVPTAAICTSYPHSTPPQSREHLQTPGQLAGNCL